MNIAQLLFHFGRVESQTDRANFLLVSSQKKTCPQKERLSTEGLSVVVSFLTALYEAMDHRQLLAQTHTLREFSCEDTQIVLYMPPYEAPLTNATARYMP